jgi:hypothetical protein
MSKFIEYISASHFNNKNIALYENEKGASLRAEQVINDACLGVMQFDSIDEAKEWYENIEGNKINKLINALELLMKIKK